jgi:XTP/dITP diphosphohydrolase
MTSLVVATRNAHKVGEIQAILGPGFRCTPLTAFPEAPRLVEDGDTFAANAAMKARQLAAWLLAPGTPDRPVVPPTSLVLADDSGLEVDALNGAPGVHSARFAAGESGPGHNAPDAANNAKLLRLLQGLPPGRRTARFRCVLALVWAGQPPGAGDPILFEGRCEGRIGLEPRGQGGFGYDPLFIPAGLEESFAELGGEMKNSLSHRFRALDKLRRHLLAG